ncbi:unnamed protein product [Euphydryas editha]|uniref:Uncharacterized protein n=1 Tax=Euphydryas editha TaxID=104508 RepID=A0AAU9VD64_EUPED|nr:unnamed protein product [Euphydryas editha]
MRRTFPRRWVSARPSRLCAVKVTPPPENGRLARENKGAERSPASTPRDSLSFGLNALRSRTLLMSEPTGERNLWILGTKSVEKRRSGGGVCDGRPSD